MTGNQNVVRAKIYTYKIWSLEKTLHTINTYKFKIYCNRDDCAFINYSVHKIL